MKPKNSSRKERVEDIKLVFILIGLAAVGGWATSLLTHLGSGVLIGLKVAFSLILVFIFFRKK